MSRSYILLKCCPQFSIMDTWLLSTTSPMLYGALSSERRTEAAISSITLPLIRWFVRRRDLAQANQVP
ncbi:hypothetical protein H2248_007728 [Termitomyces sp. 'cryptogamus']|nr:hypothetical protein H2248_007728 [Termitomyces sp. 'cryptogamus']